MERRTFLRALSAFSLLAPAAAMASKPTVDDDDGPLLADDVTGTTAYADWHERKHGFRLDH